MEDEHGQRQVSRNPLEKGFVKIWDAGVTIDHYQSRGANLTASRYELPHIPPTGDLRATINASIRQKNKYEVRGDVL